MTALLAGLLAWIPFVHPLPLPPGARLWMFPPLALCIALVYRATRARSLERLARSTFITFINIVIGMWLIAFAVYGLHHLILSLT